MDTTVLYNLSYGLYIVSAFVDGRAVRMYHKRAFK